MLLKIRQGTLEGREDISFTSGKTFYSFLGIPYAEPPVGNLRFEPPVPAACWDGIRDAKYDRNRCFAATTESRSTNNESEDCLYINVFTSEPPNEETPLKPVMVHIHGGGYYFGAGTMDAASPDHLVDHDVIFVSFNYRLHLFGFLNVNTASSAGNCGCKDMVLALRWIKQNIRSFGGDPENVTIFGESAGGSAIHLLTVSPLSAGLFHKAIVESGSIIGPWIQEDQVEAAYEIGRKLGFVGTTAEDLVEFLKKQPAATLTKEASMLIATRKACMPAAMDGTLIFVPSIERASNADDAFLSDYPFNLLSNIEQPIPMIAGVAEKEGVCVLFGIENYETFFAHLTRNIDHLVRWNVPCHSSKVSEISRKILEYYFVPVGETVSEEETREKIVEIYSHLFFRSFYKIIEMTSKATAPVYVYSFGYSGSLNESRNWSMNLSGALHADESEYITLSRAFHPNGPVLDETDRSVIANLCTAWTNFAKTSDPNPLPDDNVKWMKYNPREPSYLLFDETCTAKNGKIWNDGLNFWNEIFSEYVDWNRNENHKLRL